MHIYTLAAGGKVEAKEECEKGRVVGWVSKTSLNQDDFFLLLILPLSLITKGLLDVKYIKK